LTAIWVQLKARRVTDYRGVTRELAFVLCNPSPLDLDPFRETLVIIVKESQKLSFGLRDNPIYRSSHSLVRLLSTDSQLRIYRGHRIENVAGTVIRAIVYSEDFNRAPRLRKCRSDRPLNRRRCIESSNTDGDKRSHDPALP
jgi:hypothetical protein